MMKRLFVLIFSALMLCCSALHAQKETHKFDAVKFTPEYLSKIKNNFSQNFTVSIEKDTDGSEYLLFKKIKDHTYPVYMELPAVALVAPKKDFLTGSTLSVEAEYFIPGDGKGMAWLMILDPAGKEYANKHAGSWPAGFFQTGIDGAKPMKGWKTGKGIMNLPEGLTVVTPKLYLWPSSPQEFRLKRVTLTEENNYTHTFRVGGIHQMIADESGEFSCQLYHADQIKSGKVSLLDEYDKVLKTYEIKPGMKEVKGILPERGYYSIQAETTQKDGAVVKAQTSAAVVGKPLDEKVRRQSRYGLGHVQNIGFDWAKQLGINQLYSLWNLSVIQKGKDGKLYCDPSKNNYDNGFEENSPYRDFTLNSAWFEPIPSFLQAPMDPKKGWFREHFIAKDWNRMGEAVRLWAENVKYPPERITLYNEPTFGTEEDALFMKAIAEAKKAKPQIEIVGPNTYEINIDYLNRFRKAGGLKALDAISLHNYSQAERPEGSFADKIDQLQKFLNEYAPKMPIYITEFGYTTFPGDWQKDVPEITRTRYMARANIIATAKDVKALVNFTGKMHNFPVGNGYSMVNQDCTPTPAVAALGTLIRELSAVKGGGKLLNLEPDVYLAVFPRDGNTIGALWTTGPEKTVMLPQKPDYVRSITGRLLPAERKQQISESVIYFQIPGTALANCKVLPEETIMRKQGFAFPGNGQETIPSQFTKQGNTYAAGDKAPKGSYGILRFAKGKYVLKRYVIGEYIISRYIGWKPVPGKLDQVDMIFGVTPCHERVKTSKSILKQDLFNGEFAYQEQEVKFAKAGLEKQVSYRISNLLSNKYGAVFFYIKQPEDTFARTVFDDLPMVVPYFANGGIDWSKAPDVSVKKTWNDKMNIPAGIPDANFKIAADKAGIHLHATVSESEHDPEFSVNAWKQDSIQIAFDADKESKWDFNNVHSKRLNGHRVCQYCLAGNADRSFVWCYDDHADGLEQGEQKDLEKTASVHFDAAKKMTEYKLFLPWKAVGIQKQPAADFTMGFAFLLNDADPEGNRRTLPFFDGIYTPDPMKYGKIVFIKVQ